MLNSQAPPLYLVHTYPLSFLQESKAIRCYLAIALALHESSSGRQMFISTSDLSLVLMEPEPPSPISRSSFLKLPFPRIIQSMDAHEAGVLSLSAELRTYRSGACFHPCCVVEFASFGPTCCKGRYFGTMCRL